MSQEKLSEYKKNVEKYLPQNVAFLTSPIGDLPITSDGLRKAIDEIIRLQNERDAYKRVKDYWDSLFGQGLEIVNWHLNGDTEPFETFWESAETEVGKNE